MQFSAGCLSCYRIEKADQRKRSQLSQFRSTNLRRECRNGGQFCTSIREALEKASQVFRQLLYFAFLSQSHDSSHVSMNHQEAGGYVTGQVSID